MQTILGGGGAIGTELAKALTSFTKEIRIVGRNPVTVNESDILLKADLTDREQVLRAVEGSEVVYLTAGLPYDIRIWRVSWPLIIQHVTDACLASGARLVFFDNIYMYDGNKLDPIREDHQVNPPSKKGKVRAEIAQMLWNAVKDKGLNALIARCADFYGPSIKNTSLLTELVFNPLSKGSVANWMGNANCRHSYTYTPDAAKATALLGNTPDAFGEVWHLPTASDPYTGKEWVETIAKEFGVKPRYRVMKKWMVNLMGVFMPLMKELAEMQYQNDRDYVFNSDKFEQRFSSFRTTPYIAGIREVIGADYRRP